jgi:hypothetical protein
MNEMQSLNAERNFIANAKQKWKNRSKIVSHVFKKKHHAQNSGKRRSGHITVAMTL